MKVIFMGTPSFAVPTLKQLIESKHSVVAVYTKPPKPAGRGYAETKSAIHELAEQGGLKVYTPATFKNQEAVDQFLSIDADITVVAAYGLILRKVVLGATKYGCINIHPSQLPRWRGAAPIQHTILAGDRETAVCIMKMDEGLDTGDIILQRNLRLDDKITAHELHDKTSAIGADIVIEALDRIENGSATFTKQASDGVTYANKLSKVDELIDWSKSSYLINCQIRALTPKPGAYFKFKDEVIKIIAAEYTEDTTSHQSGEVVDEMLSIACGKGILMPKLLQREGKKMIYTDAFLRGFPIPKASRL